MFLRSLERKIGSYIGKGKAIVVTGPRQVGKTTLLKKMVGEANVKALVLDAEDPKIQLLFEKAGKSNLESIVRGFDWLVIDEAQRLKDIGVTAKLLVDHFPHVQLFLTGSSALDLAQKTGEPLTGRKFSFNLWPLTWQEYEAGVGYASAFTRLEQRLVFGFYPEIVTQPDMQEVLLRELTESYLYKDVLVYGNIRKPELLQKLLKALAHQVGHEVNYKEVGDLISSDSKTVSHYIDLLEKSFVVFRLPSFSQNVRNEIKNGKKIYFYDNGVRNAVIGDLSPLANRKDLGQLWENFLISERMKANSYQGRFAELYFWRTKQQQEIDLIELENGQLTAFEFKWNPERKVKWPTTYFTNYQSERQFIHRDNFREFVGVV